MNANAADLSILECPGCGDAVALSDGPTTTCSRCKTAVSIPETHRIAREVAESEASADGLTREAFRTLGKAPPWPLRMLSFFTPGWALLVNVMFLAVSTAIVTWLFDHAGDWLRVNAYDYFSFPEQLLMTWGLAFTIATLGLVLGAYGRREAIHLGSLQRALAAIPPARLGGPATCRICGAPLEVPARAIGVRCTHCRSDNLVALDATWVGRQKRGVEGLLVQAKDALASHRKELRRLRIRVAVSLGVVGILGFIIVGPILRNALRGDNSVFALRSALARPRELFDVHVKLVGYNSPPAARPFPISQCTEMHEVRSDELDCLEQHCWVGWFVALTKNEKLAMKTNHEGTIQLYDHKKDRGWADADTLAERWGTLVSEARLKSGVSTTVDATRTSWYRVKMDVERSDLPLRVCAQLSR